MALFHQGSKGFEKMNGSLDHVSIHFRALTECIISRSIQVLRNTPLKSPLEHPLVLMNIDRMGAIQLPIPIFI